MQVRELQDGCRVATPLLVRGVELRCGRDGGEYLRLTVGDRTGTVPALVLDGVDDARGVCRAGEVVHVIGCFDVDARFGARVLVEEVRAVPAGEFDAAQLIDGPSQSTAQMEADLRELIATVQSPHLRRLLHEILGEGSPTWERFRQAPAAKHYHHGYRHGLLEHSLTVAQAVSAISAVFGGIDRDVAVTGALLHDAYDVSGEAIDMSDHGRLYGEIALGYYRVRSLIESLDDFPPEPAQAVLHIILSHHGSLEYGSPVIPCTREATLVHMVDNLGGRLGSFDRIQKALPAGAQWSAFDKGIGGGAYFAAGEQRAA
jgi:3'-5' exoribonuclease